MPDSRPDTSSGSHTFQPSPSGDAHGSRGSDCTGRSESHHDDAASTVTVHRDLVFASRSTGALVLDLYRPVVPGHVPVVLWLHGGGWFTGDRTLCPDLAARAAASGLAYASAEYRLSAQATYPAQLHDVQAAIRHLRGNADRWGLDPDRIGAWGASAGGHLALMLAAARPDSGDGVLQAASGSRGDESTGTMTDSSVQAVAVSYPPTDLTVRVNGAEGAASDPRTPEARLLGAAPSSAPDRARAASPLFHVGPHWPPVQLSHGTADTLVSWRQSEKLHRALRGFDVVSELYLVEGYRHGFLNPAGRLDVDMAKVMDDGRLDAETWANASLRWAAAGPGQSADFGFSTVDTFFRTHLSGQ